MGIDWIKRVLVAGAGTMGHSIALVFARGGYRVDLVDTDEAILERAMTLIRSNLLTLKESGMIGSRSIPRVLSRIHPVVSLSSGEAADLVIEAIVEDSKAKQSLFRSLDQICPPRTLFASNTSYLDVFRLLRTKRAKKLLIAHWYAPPHLIPLVDVVKGPRTSSETVATMKDLLLSLGKRPVVMKRFIPGYIVNRLQRAMAREIFYLLDRGYASPEDIDTAVKNSLGIRIPVVGVVQRYDFTGLDLALTFEENPSIHLVSGKGTSTTLRRLAKKGHLGVKSGRGFYDYSNQTAAHVFRERDLRLIELIKLLGRQALQK
jgi:3-hydroxybutyryl-CoA dehydrogenase